MREYDNIIRLSQIKCDEPTSIDEKKLDTVTRKALPIVEKPYLLNQNPEKDWCYPKQKFWFQSIKYKSSELDNDSYQERPTKLQEGSVQQ